MRVKASLRKDACTRIRRIVPEEIQVSKMQPALLPIAPFTKDLILECKFIRLLHAFLTNRQVLNMREFVYEKLQSINRDWEIAHSDALQTLAPHVAESWKRSFSFGVDSNMAALPPTTEQDRAIANDSMKKTGEKGGAGFGILISGLSASLETLGAVMILANQSLRVFHTCGSASALQELERRNITQGALLSERNAGTSALTLAYLCSSPCSLEPNECYSRVFEGYHAISQCISPSSDIYSMILVPKESPLPLTVIDAYATFVFDSFAALLMRDTETSIPISAQVLSLILRKQAAGYAVTDVDGSIVDLDPRLITILGDNPPQNTQGMSIVGLFPPLKPLIPLTLSHARENRRLGTIGTVRFNEKNYRIDCAPVISSDGKKLIAIVATCLSDESPLETNKNKSDYLLGSSAAAKQLRRRIQSAAENDAHVLISGESGTDKERIASEIHDGSRRSYGPFIGIRCPSYEYNDLRRRLFGANTENGSDNSGALSDARGGTLFLGEIDAMPLEIQSALVQSLEEQNRLIEYGVIDQTDAVRIIASTTRDLHTMVRTGSMRADLYYLLSAFPCKTLPLRDRQDDIPTILRAASTSMASQNKTEPIRFSDGAISQLMRHGWPGNMRELHRLLLRIGYECPNKTVTAKELLFLIEPEPQDGTPSASHTVTPAKAPSQKEHAPATSESPSLDPPNHNEASLERIKNALVEANGNKTTAARRLGITRQTLYNRMRKAGMR